MISSARIHGKTVPLLYPLLSMLLGITVFSSLKSVSGSGFIACFSLLFFFAVINHISLRNRRINFLLLLSLIFMASGYNYLRSCRATSEDISQALPFSGSLKGKVSYDNREFVVFTRSASGKRKGRFLVRSDTLTAPPGAEVLVKGFFHRPSYVSNPGTFDWSKHLAERGIFTVCDAKEVKVLKQPYISRLLDSCRAFMYSRIQMFFNDRSSSLLLAMLIGDISSIDPGDVELLRRTGTVHIVAISGLHVGIVVFIFYFLLCSLGLSKNKSWVLSLFFTFLYIFIAGFRPSATRAGIMAAVFVIGNIMGGRGNVYNSICVAAILLLAVNPGSLFNAGFIMSFTAVSGITYLMPILKKLKWNYVAVSVASIAALYPVLGWNFFYIPLLAPLINFAVVPLASFVVAGGVLFLFMSVFGTFFAEIYSMSETFMIDVLYKIVEYASSFKYCGIEISRPPVAAVVFYYVFLAAAGMKNQKMRAAVLLCSLSLVVASYPVSDYYSSETMYAVNCGHSNVLILKNRKGNMLFVYSSDIDRNTFNTVCRANRIDKIDTVFVMQPLFGSMSDLSALCSDHKAERLIYPGSVGSEKEWQDFTDKVRFSEIQTARSGDVISSGSINIIIKEPYKKYVDIRDNVIQAELNTKSGSSVFLYTGGDEPGSYYDYIVSFDPYNPDWNVLKAHSRRKLVCLGQSEPGKDVFWAVKHGHSFRL